MIEPSFPQPAYYDDIYAKHQPYDLYHSLASHNTEAL